MKTKLLILFTVLIDIVGIGVVIPILPFYVKSFHVSDFAVTALFSVFAFLAFFSAPFLGTLSDRFGRRPVLIISIVSTALGWMVFAGAHSVLWLFVGRMIDGLAAGNISTAQSYLSDIARDEKERTANLGLIGAMFGVGLVVGPLIGGVLSAISPNAPFWAVGALAALNAFLAFLWLPETHHNRSAKRKIQRNPFAPFIRAFSHPRLLPPMVAWFLFGMGISAQQSVFALFVSKVFGYTAFVTGMMFTGVGAVILLNQTFFLRRIWLKYFEDLFLLRLMFFLLAAGFACMAPPALAPFAVGVMLMTISQTIIRTTMSSLISGLEPLRRGENLGTMTSFFSLSMVLGPLLAGRLFLWNPSFPFMAASLFAVAGFAIMERWSRRAAIPATETGAFIESS